MIPCPTCRQSGTSPCIRGRWPSAIWKQGNAMPKWHDSRVTVNK